VIVGVFLLGAYYASRPMATSESARMWPNTSAAWHALVDTLAAGDLIGTMRQAGCTITIQPPFMAGIIGIAGVVALGALLIAPTAATSRFGCVFWNRADRRLTG
jgi:hypothetical protein